MKVLLLTVLLATLILSVASSKPKRGKGSKCKIATPADIDQEWYLEQGEIGFNYPYGSKLTSMSSDDSLYVPPTEDMSLENKNCWTLFTKILDRIVPLQLGARFDRINMGKADIRTDKTPSVASVFQFHADFTIVLTDNSTFALVYGCLFEKNPFWLLTVPVESELSDETKEEALIHVVKELKFGRGKKDLASDRDGVRFKGSTMKECVGDDAPASKGVSKLGVPKLG